MLSNSDTNNNNYDEGFVDATDLKFFTPENDLFEAQQTPTFDTRRLDQTIAYSARRALQVCNALAQKMLAQYRPNPDHTESQDIAQVKAEHIAFDLGFEEFDAERAIDNPFDDPTLSQAWQEGMNSARQSNHNTPIQQLEDKYWEEGINTEDSGSQYELCALQLYKIAASISESKEAERAKRLAMEMCRYWEGETPTEQRQQEINNFMGAQTARLASDLEL